MRLKKPFKFTFMPWLHWQEFRQHTSEKADFWVRYMRIGRFMILWNAPDNGTPNREAHFRSTHETKLRIPKDQP